MGCNFNHILSIRLIDSLTIIHLFFNKVFETISDHVAIQNIIANTALNLFQVGPTATQAMQEFLTRLQVHLSSACPQMFSEFLLKLIHILSIER